MKITSPVPLCSKASKNSSLLPLRQPRFATSSAAVVACFLTIAAGFCWQAQAADQLLPFYDAFPTTYGDGTALGLSGNPSASVWTTANSVGAGGLTNRSSAALSYPGLATSSGLGVVIPTFGSSSRSKGIQFNPGTFGAGNPTLYASFLLNIQTSPTALRTLLYMRNSTGSGTPAVGLFVTTTNTLLMSKNSTTRRQDSP